MASYFFGVLSWLWEKLVEVFNWLIIDIQLPHWLFIVLLVFPTVSVIKFIAKLNKNSHAQKIDYHNYRQDIIFGIKWRWRYSSIDDGIMELTAFCTDCDFQVYPQRTSSYQIVDNIGFKCEDCGKELETFEFNYAVLEDKVTRKIHKYLRTGEWVKRMKLLDA